MGYKRSVDYSYGALNIMTNNPVESYGPNTMATNIEQAKLRIELETLKSDMAELKRDQSEDEDRYVSKSEFNILKAMLAAIGSAMLVGIVAIVVQLATK